MGQPPEPGISWPSVATTSTPAPTRARRRPQTTAVVVLSLTLAGLVALWVVGGSVLWHYGPQLDVPLPGSTSAPATSPTR
jgi:hypothetical protein